MTRTEFNNQVNQDMHGLINKYAKEYADYIECKHCEEFTHIGSLIGKHTNNCPCCGNKVLFNKVTA